MAVPVTNALAAYRAKRNFASSPEPNGEARVPRGCAPRFVIHMHAARRLHFDLRLEVEGVLRSWALTRAPSLDPSTKRLAIEVEDHPLDYGDFEGVIPKGAYGAGASMIWDRGYWESDSGETQTALRQGELKLTLMGERVRGGFVLVRLREGAKSRSRQWLLIKHDDPYADQSVDLADYAQSVASGRSMHDLSRGAPANIKPFFVRSGKTCRLEAGVFVEPQLCARGDSAPNGPGWQHEIKYDGYRLQVHTGGTGASLWTRAGNDFSARAAGVLDDARRLPEAILDGELVALDEMGASDFSLLQAALRTGQVSSLVYFAFDVLAVGGQNLRALPLWLRRRRLLGLLDGFEGQAITPAPAFVGSGAEMFEAASRVGLEGIISKRIDAPYQSGRTSDWVKVKSRAEQVLIIGGYIAVSGRLKSLLVGRLIEGRLEYVGRVGSGLSGAATDGLLGRLSEGERKSSAFEPHAGLRARKGQGEAIRWVTPTVYARVASAGWTQEGLLRQASLVGLDPQSGPAPGPVRPALKGFSVHGVSISNPEKVLWPAENGEAITKGDLVRYFDAFGDDILDYVRGRPCSLLRAPNGIAKACFFQRHAMAGQSEAFTLVLSGNRKPYLQIDNREALIAAAQSGAIELHPWNCAPNEPDVPGRLVFDLDPGEDTPFTKVVDAALRVRDFLAEFGLVGFCKTSGGKGLHVVAPLAFARGRRPKWPEAKQFARTLCEAMVRESPSELVAVMSKSARRGKVFLDYFRNDRGATAVAAFSPRARSGAPISMPIAWEQVTAKLDPLRYTIRDVPSHRPWRDYREAARPLPKLG